MIDFHKYHGLGNDFIIIDDAPHALSADEVVALCDRRRGVGADGVLLVDLIDKGPVPRCEMVIINRDGSRPQMCGNGVRCVAAYAKKYWGVEGELIVESDAGPRRCDIGSKSSGAWMVSVDMGEADIQRIEEPLIVDERSFDYVYVDVGNPHAVIFEQPGDDVVDRAGEVSNSAHRAFEQGVNVEFVSPGPARAEFEVVVYERGVGRTRACGTGACAVAAAVWETGKVAKDEPVTIELPGGALTIELRDTRLWMTGEAKEVFSGIWLSDISDGESGPR